MAKKSCKSKGVHNQDVGDGSMVRLMKGKMLLDRDLRNLSNVEKTFLQQREGTATDYERAIGVVKKVRRLHKQQGIKI